MSIHRTFAAVAVLTACAPARGPALHPWTVIPSANEGWQAAMPVAPTESQPSPLVKTYSAQVQQSSFVIIVAMVSPERLRAHGEVGYFAAVVKGFVDEAQAASTRPAAQDIEHKGLRGVEIEDIHRGLRRRTRLFLYRGRLYSIIAAWPRDARDGEAQASRFLQSFVVTR
jgi:hypothetical protein